MEEKKAGLPAVIAPKAKDLPRLSLWDAAVLIADNCTAIRPYCFGKGDDFAFILPKAWQRIKVFFDYGEKTPNNRYEAKANLYGHRFMDAHGHYIDVVSDVEYIYAATRSETYVAVSTDGKSDFMQYRLKAEHSIYNRFEKARNVGRDGKLFDPFLDYGPSEYLGDIHTHPQIGVFFSATDRASNESTLMRHNLYIVCDPIKEDLTAMAGVDERPVRLVVCEKR